MSADPHGIGEGASPRGGRSPTPQRASRWRAGWSALLLVVGGLAALLVLARLAPPDSRPGRVVAFGVRAAERLPFAPANVAWPRATPSGEGFDAAVLDDLRAQLVPRGTRALLVARNGRLVLEDYGSPWRGPNQRFSNAAMAKSVTAALTVLLAWDRGRLDPDDPVARYVPVWRDDPLRARITLRQLLTHSAGIENVSFQREHEGWKAAYRRDLDGRFRLALEQAPVEFEPGSRYAYSGVGFYVVAYVVGRSLAGAPETDARTLLRERLMRPLDIPDRAWRINYGRTAHVDGMALYALGSGADYTPRAIARVGQLLLDEGRYQGQTLISPEHVQAMLRYGGSPATRLPDAEQPATGFGTWLNCDGYFPSLPRDAVLGAGAGHQVLLVVPSWRLVLVRLGDPLGRDEWEGDYWDALESGILAPLARALPVPSATSDAPRCGTSSRARTAPGKAPAGG